MLARSRDAVGVVRIGDLVDGIQKEKECFKRLNGERRWLEVFCID